MLEAGRLGLKSLLLEQGDFGAATSLNNNRIVHGGLRYLQSLHLSRFRESVAERSWFLREFPDLVTPLACLMPLYGGLTRNRNLLRLALTVNDALSRDRNQDLPAAQQLPGGRILDVDETRERFNAVRLEGLVGSALWYDAVMLDCHRLLIEVLRWATLAGGTALNYVEATDLRIDGGALVGVHATEKRTGKPFCFQASRVVNAAGPQAASLAERLTGRMPDLYKPSLAWNLLMDRAGLSDAALAVQSPDPGAHMYFVHTLDQRMLIGTGHMPLPRNSTSTDVPMENIERMLNEINRAIPTLDLRVSELHRVLSGQLPVNKPSTTSLAATPAIVDHSISDGPAGLYTVSGVKYTTSRSTAARVIAMLCSKGGVQRSGPAPGLPPRPLPNRYHLHPDTAREPQDWADRARNLIATESAHTLSDLFMRRSDLINEPQVALNLAHDGCDAFGWNSKVCAAEIERLNDYVGSAFIVK
jgi:glycerol-3-phosphate dehydrogenase